MKQAPPSLRAFQTGLCRPSNLADLNQWYERYFASLHHTLPAPQVSSDGLKHLISTVNGLLELGAETELNQAVKDFTLTSSHLRASPLTGVSPHVLVLDYSGQPTERYLSEMYFRFFTDALAKQGRLLLVWWADQELSKVEVTMAAKEAVYRHHFQCLCGMPRTLAEMLRQEGLAQSYSGRPLSLSPSQREAAAAIVQNHLDSSSYRHQFTCIFGDRIARHLDYAPLGLAERAGLELAAARARATGIDPLAFHNNEAALASVS